MPGYAALDSRDIVAGFYPRFEQAIAAGWGARVYMPIGSDSEVENYKWLGQVSQLRQWIGGRQAQVLNRFSMSITNNKYEASLEIPLDDLRRDKTGQLRIRIDGLADKAADHPTSLLSTLINGNGTGYDGQNFFDTDHNESGSNQVNALTVTQVPSANVSDTAAPTADEMANVLVETIGHFYSITDDKGDPMNGAHRQFLVVTPNARYWAAAQKAVSLNNLASGATNPVMGLSAAGVGLTVILEPRLTTISTDLQILVFATDGATRPFIYQEEVPLTTSLLGEGSDYEFDNDAHLFGLKKSCNVGFGFWQKAMRVTLS